MFNRSENINSKLQFTNMLCHFLNKTLRNLSKSYSPYPRIWSECYKGVDEYSSDEEMAQVQLFLDYPDALLKFAAVCSFTFMTLGIPGNIVTIVALYKYKKVRNATAIFIINLSVCDLLLACTIMPVAVSMFINQSWTSGRVMCRVFPALKYTLNTVSLFSIVAITINRYVMVSHPVHYATLYQTKNLAIMIIAIWIGAFSTILPVLSEIWGRFSLDPKIGFCTIIPDKNNNSPKCTMAVMGFVFPCVIIVVCYSRIMYIVRKSTAICTSKPLTPNAHSESTSRNQEIPMRELTSTSAQEENRDNMKPKPGFLTNLKNFQDKFRRKQIVYTAPTKRDKRLQTMIIAIMISFFTCHLPVMIAEAMSPGLTMGPYGNIMGNTLLFMTICSNPIIYVIMSKEYRQAYKSVFGVLCKKNIV